MLLASSPYSHYRFLHIHEKINPLVEEALDLNYQLQTPLHAITDLEARVNRVFQLLISECQIASKKDHCYNLEDPLLKTSYFDNIQKKFLKALNWIKTYPRQEYDIDQRSPLEYTLTMNFNITGEYLAKHLTSPIDFFIDPNTSTVLVDYGIVSDHLLMMMPHMTLDNLDRRPIGTLQHITPANLPDFIKIMRNISLALIFLQRARLLHLCISPISILVYPDGKGKLLDGGLLKQAQTPQEDGVFPFQAPEILAKKGFPISSAADTWSFAMVCVCYLLNALENPMEHLETIHSLINYKSTIASETPKEILEQEYISQLVESFEMLACSPKSNNFSSQKFLENLKTTLNPSQDPHINYLIEHIIYPCLELDPSCRLMSDELAKRMDVLWETLKKDLASSKELAEQLQLSMRTHL